MVRVEARILLCITHVVDQVGEVRPYIICVSAHLWVMEMSWAVLILIYVELFLREKGDGQQDTMVSLLGEMQVQVCMTAINGRYTAFATLSGPGDSHDGTE